MGNSYRIVLFFLFCVSAFFIFPANSQENEDLNAKITMCAACHGPTGSSTVEIYPNLAGQHLKYTEKQLWDFKNGDDSGRYNEVMYGMAAILDSDLIKALAAFYAKQSIQPGVAEQKDLAFGEQIYRGGIREEGLPACAACHGPAGLGNNAAAFPVLSGQHAAYIVQQLKAYQSGNRTNDPNEMMGDIAKKMNDEQIEAVANYISGLH